MWFPLSLIALLCWSGSDLFSKMGSKPDDPYSHWKMVMAVGLIMGLHAAWQILFQGTEISLSILWRYLPVSALYISSMVLGYVGLRYIELSISSPICNSSGAICAMLCFVFLRQTLAWLQVLAIALVCCGVVLLGVVEMREDDELKLERQKRENVRYTKSALALILPLLYCVLDAAGTFADAVILETMDENSANAAYELTFAFMAILSFLYVVVIRRQRFTLSRELPKLAAGVFETGGQFAYVFAMSDKAIAAAPIVSSYCVASVLWSRIFLREKLSWKHYAAIAITVVGIIILGIYDV